MTTPTYNRTLFSGFLQINCELDIFVIFMFIAQFYGCLLQNQYLLKLFVSGIPTNFITDMKDKKIPFWSGTSFSSFLSETLFVRSFWPPDKLTSDNWGVRPFEWFLFSYSHSMQFCMKNLVLLATVSHYKCWQKMEAEEVEFLNDVVQHDGKENDSFVWKILGKFL